MKIRLDDYIDGDVAYLIGLVIGRGTIIEDGLQLTIEFPYASLEAQGIGQSFNQETSIRLGLSDIRERLLDLLDTDIKIIRKERDVDFLIRFQRPSMIWRNILLITDGAISYRHFRVPPIFFDPDLPVEWKREFIRGFADVAGNVRLSNNYVDSRNRVRLDVLNHPANWEMPVQLCRLLQEQLDVPVQLITWGHPNMNRKFREHQINIFAKTFLKIGFSFEHKQKILEELAGHDTDHKPGASYAPCPGMRELRGSKPSDPEENNSTKLDSRLVGNHYDAYWQICRDLGCSRMPDSQLKIEFVEELNLEEDKD